MLKMKVDNLKRILVAAVIGGVALLGVGMPANAHQQEQVRQDKLKKDKEQKAQPAKKEQRQQQRAQRQQQPATQQQPAQQQQRAQKGTLKGPQFTCVTTRVMRNFQ